MKKVLTGKTISVPLNLLKDLFGSKLTTTEFKDLLLELHMERMEIAADPYKIPPLPEAVKRYAKHIDFPEINEEEFMDYYETRGWKIGRVPMKNWQAAVRTWKRTRDRIKAESTSGEATDCRPCDSIEEAANLFGEME